MNGKLSFWLRLFNIRHDEKTTVQNLVLHHFFSGIGQALLFTVASTLFLSEYGAEQLPIAYMLAALAMMIVGRTYSFLEHKLSIRQLLLTVMTGMVLIPFVLRSSFYFDQIKYVPFIILIGERIFYLLSNLEFWCMSSLVFDVRQGKRLFGLISSGDIPAKLLGYLSVSFLAPILGINNLLWVAAGAILLASIFLRKILRQPDINFQVREAPNEHFTHKQLLLNFFGNHYIFVLSGMAFLTIVAFTFLDFTFLHNVQGQYKTQESLASYISMFFAIGYGIIIVIKLLLSGRLAEQTGIKFSLLIMPVMFLIFSIGFIFFGSHDSEVYDNLLYISIMFMATSVAKYAVNDPVFLAMFQPLPTLLRLKGHTIIKGFIQPLALGLTGFALWIIFNFSNTINFYSLNLVILILAVVWINSIIRSHKLYITTLATAIRNRFISGSEIAMESALYSKLLKESIYNNQDDDIIYGITALDVKFPEILRKEMKFVLSVNSESVKRVALHILNTRGWHEYVHEVKHLYKTETNDIIKAEAAFFCAQAGDTEIQNLSNHEDFHHLPDLIETAILKGILKSESNIQQKNAINKISILLNSEFENDRIKALSILSQEYCNEFEEDILRLMASKNLRIQKHAVYVAGKSKLPVYLPQLITFMLRSPGADEIIESLSFYGDDIFDHIQKIPFQSVIHKHGVLTDIIRIAEITAGRKGGEFLFSILHHTPPYSKERIVEVLSISKYVLNVHEKERMERMLKEEIGFVTALLEGITDSSLNERLREAFNFDFENCKRRIVTIAGLLYNRKIMREAAAAFRNTSKERKANALEIMEQVIPRKTAQILIVLLDNISPAQKLGHLQKFHMTRKHEIPDSILRDGTDYYNTWTVCLALRSAAYHDSNYIHAVNILHTEGNLLRESAKYYLLNFKENHPIHYSTLASTFKSNSEEIMKHKTENTISDFEKVLVLKGTALFAGTPENIIAEIIPIVREVRVNAGEVLFDKGDSGSSMYIIYNGEIKIHDGDKTFAKLGKREFFGELALLDPEPRSASATATTDTLLLKLEEEEAYELMEERTEVLRSILTILCRRIRMQNDKLVASGAFK